MRRPVVRPAYIIPYETSTVLFFVYTTHLTNRTNAPLDVFLLRDDGDSNDGEEVMSRVSLSFTGSVSHSRQAQAQLPTLEYGPRRRDPCFILSLPSRSITHDTSSLGAGRRSLLLLLPPFSPPPRPRTTDLPLTLGNTNSCLGKRRAGPRPRPSLLLPKSTGPDKTREIMQREGDSRGLQLHYRHHLPCFPSSFALFLCSVITLLLSRVRSSLCSWRRRRRTTTRSSPR